MTKPNTNTTENNIQSADNLLVSPGEIIIGTLVGVDSHGQPLINFPDNPHMNPLPAMTTLPVTVQLIGRQVALLFANGKLDKPVIMGLIHNPLHELIASYEADTAEQDKDQTNIIPEPTLQNVTIDGKRIVFEGKEEVVIRCGDASIT